MFNKLTSGKQLANVCAKSTTNLQKLANHRLNKPTSGLLGGGPVSKTMSLVFLPSTFFIENELKQVLAVEALSREC
jgi:hypothetical protein